MERRQACALRKSARRIARCGGGYPAFAGVPLPSFICFLKLDRRNGRNGTLKDRPHPCSFPGPDRFRASRDRILLARDPFEVARKENSYAETRRENGGFRRESPQKLARRTPSPQRGEGWGEGFGLQSKNSESRTPSSCPSPPSVRLRASSTRYGAEGTQRAGRARMERHACFTFSAGRCI